MHALRRLRAARVAAASSSLLRLHNSASLPAISSSSHGGRSIIQRSGAASAAEARDISNASGPPAADPPSPVAKGKKGKGFSSSNRSSNGKHGHVSHPDASQQRHARTELAMQEINRSLGLTVMPLGGPGIPHDDLEVISTGSLALDAALGIGGLPRGRVVEIFGPESSGKTTLALHVIAEAQKKGGSCLFIDVEHALSTSLASAIGVDLSRLYLAQPDFAEQALEAAATAVRSGGIDIVVIDSVAALVTKGELEGDMGDAHMAGQARLMSQAMRKLTSSNSKSNTMLIFINQVRHKLATFGNFGPPAETTPGGNALKYYSSVRLNIRRTGSVERGGEVIGNTVRVKVAKNKLAPPFGVADFDLEFGHGISQEGELVDLGVKAGVVRKSGSWFYIDDQAIGHGRDRAKQYFKDNEEVAARVREEVIVMLRGEASEGAVEESSGGDEDEEEGEKEQGDV